MKKILLVANRTNSLWFFRKEIIRSLIKKKYQVIIVANEDEYYKYLKRYNIKFHLIKKNINSFNIINLAVLFLKLVQISIKYKPDIVQSYTIVPNLLCPLIKIFHNCKVFCMITGMGYVLSSGNKFLLYFSSILYKISLNFCDHLIFTNKFNREFFIKNNIYSKNSYSLIPASGINKNKYKKKKRKKSKYFNILFIGRLIKSKGIFDLLYIFRGLRIKNKKLTIIGKEDKFSPEGIDISKLIKNEKNIKHIKFSDNLENYYNNSDIFLFPSYSEGMPTVVMEAFSCGLPCYTYKVPGCDDIVVNNITGYKVNIHSKKKMIKIIEKTIKNKKKLNQISKNCIEYSKKFNRDFIVEKVLKSYDESI